MDKIMYKGDYVLLLDTNDLINHRWFEIDIMELMEDKKVKHLLVITNLPLSAIPLSIRNILLEGDCAICFRGKLK